MLLYFIIILCYVFFLHILQFLNKTSERLTTVHVIQLNFKRTWSRIILFVKFFCLFILLVFSSSKFCVLLFISQHIYIYFLFSLMLMNVVTRMKYNKRKIWYRLLTLLLLLYFCFKTWNILEKFIIFFPCWWTFPTFIFSKSTK